MGHNQAYPTLHDLLPQQELAAAIDAGHVTRKPHPELPLSIYTYTRTAQYERVWNRVTMCCRGLVADDATGAIVALPLPKFFNVGEHEEGRPYAPALPDEPFEVYDKVDGSLAVVFHYAGSWRVASKGSFISTQATWGQRYLDGRDTSALDPRVTYLAEILYPQNRIVVDYGDRRDLVLLAAYGLDGTEVRLAEAAVDWQGIGSVVTVWPAMPLAELLALAASNTLPGGEDAAAPTPRASCCGSPPACARRRSCPSTYACTSWSPESPSGTSGAPTASSASPAFPPRSWRRA